MPIYVYDNTELVNNKINWPDHSHVINPIHYQRIQTPTRWGLYEVERIQNTVEIRYCRFHAGKYQDPQIVTEEFNTEEEAINYYRNHSYSPSKFFKHDPKIWCLPVTERDDEIRAFMSQHEIPTIVVRKRKGKTYTVEYQMTRMECQDYHEPHIHACKIVVKEQNKFGIVYTAEFGCNAIWDSLKTYLQILNNFDIALLANAIS